MKKAFATWGILIVLLFSIVGTVAAQSGDGPTATPTAAPTQVVTTEVPTDVPTDGPTAVPTALPGAKFFTHPVVQVLSAYFDRPRSTNPYQQTPTPDPLATVDPLATPTAPVVSESGLGPIGEQIAAYHEEGMGFGVLVKVFAMVEASQEACGAAAPSTDPAAEPCTPLTADELVTSLQSGTGVGQLYKEYGKPALLGVGHVKKKVKEMGDQPQQPEQPTEAVVTAPEAGAQSTPVAPGKGNGNGKGNNGKGNNGKGPHK